MMILRLLKIFEKEERKRRKGNFSLSFRTEKLPFPSRLFRIFSSFSFCHKTKYPCSIICIRTTKAKMLESFVCVFYLVYAISKIQSRPE